jgi:hypothetical protein
MGFEWVLQSQEVALRIEAPANFANQITPVAVSRVIHLSVFPLVVYIQTREKFLNPGKLLDLTNPVNSAVSN